MNRRLLLSSALLATAFLVASCATAPRTAQEDMVYKKVAVLSILDERAPVVRVGLTVFNNDTVTLNLTGRANTTAESVVLQRLRTKRSAADFVTLNADRASLLRKLKATWGSSQFGSLAPEIGAIAKAAGADAVYVVAPWVTERSPISGVGISMRTMSLSSVGVANVHAEVVVYVVTSDGTVVTNRGGGNNRTTSINATDLGLTYQLDAVSSPAVAEACENAVLKQLSSTLSTALGYLGY